MTTAPDTHQFFATAPKGLELLLAAELGQIGVAEVRDARSGATFAGSLADAYRVCLWSRLANRVLLKLSEFPAPDAAALYAGIQALDWAEWFAPDATLAVECVSSRSALSHSQFVAQKVKDAVVDQFRDLCGSRPSVDLKQPDVRIHVYLEKDIASVSLDLSGDSLHKRGYRLDGGAAPLKENLAAAILLRAGWPEVANLGGALFDPMCGSGTLLIEAALMAYDIAPGLNRERFGFHGLKSHDESIWQGLLTEAEQRRELGLTRVIAISGHDADRRAVHAALENIDRARLRGKVHVERKDLGDAAPRAATGLCIVNPPYGERLDAEGGLVPLYEQLGRVLRERFEGWRASVFTGNPELSFRLGIRAQKSYALFNGAIPCKLFNFTVNPERYFTPREDESQLSEEAKHLRALQRRAAANVRRGEVGPGAEMFANRLAKNLKNLGRWAEQSGIACYRLYDADLPEYAAAIDLYACSDGTHALVQEYAAPSSIPPEKAEARLLDMLAVLPDALQLSAERIHLRVRRKQKGAAQYEKQAEGGQFYETSEGGSKFWVNFEDYLDSGLFLDHRPTRLMIRERAKGLRFLNLFAYTGAASVHAAAGGAVATTTVDMSATYLDWARQNLALNGFGGKAHRLVQADCLNWLETESEVRRDLYDLIFLDPPTFSNSKRMQASFDIQRDHVDLIDMATRLLTPGGLLIFSTNFRKFKIDAEALADCRIEDVTARTIPKDFARNARIHVCYFIHVKESR